VGAAHPGEGGHRPDQQARGSRGEPPGHDAAEEPQPGRLEEERDVPSAERVPLNHQAFRDR